LKKVLVFISLLMVLTKSFAMDRKIEDLSMESAARKAILGGTATKIVKRGMRATVWRDEDASLNILVKNTRFSDDQVQREIDKILLTWRRKVYKSLNVSIDNSGRKRRGGLELIGSWCVGGSAVPPEASSWHCGALGASAITFGDDKRLSDPFGASKYVNGVLPAH